MKKIQATLGTKLQVWGPRLGANAPTDVPVPEVMTGTQSSSKAETLEIGGWMIPSPTAATCRFPL